jgi:hypothetical protein
MRNLVMRSVKLHLLVACAALGLSNARAEGLLQGLEMDVMDAGETAAQATSRIALPQAGNVADESSPDYANLATDQALLGGERAGEAAAVDDRSTAGPAAPEPVDGASGGIDVGEPGTTDAGGGIDGNMGEEPVDSGVIEPEPGDIGVIDDAVEEPVGEPVGEDPSGGVIDGDVSVDSQSAD